MDRLSFGCRNAELRQLTSNVTLSGIGRIDRIRLCADGREIATLTRERSQLKLLSRKFTGSPSPAVLPSLTAQVLQPCGWEPADLRVATIDSGLYRSLTAGALVVRFGHDGDRVH